MFITYDTKDPNWTIWGCGYDDNESVLNAWKRIREYDPYDGSDYEPYEPKFCTMPCSKAMFDIVESDGATEDFPWVIRDGVAEYVDDPLKELRQLMLKQNRSRLGFK